MRLPFVIRSLAILLVAACQVEARWFQRTAGPSNLQQIARLLAAKPDGKTDDTVSLTRPPEAPAPPKEDAKRPHNPILTAECAKSVVFSGPGALTALIEVGIESANVRAADLMPTAEEALSDVPTSEVEGTEGTTEGAPAAVPAATPHAEAAPEGVGEPVVPVLP